MKKIRFFGSLILILLLFLSMLLFFNQGSKLELELLDVMPNDAIRTQLNFDFTVSYYEKRTWSWSVTEGVLQFPSGEQPVISDAPIDHLSSGYEDFVADAVLWSKSKPLWETLKASNEFERYGYPRMYEVSTNVGNHSLVYEFERGEVVCGERSKGKLVDYAPCAYDKKHEAVLGNVDQIEVQNITIDGRTLSTILNADGFSGINKVVEHAQNTVLDQKTLIEWENSEKVLRMMKSDGKKIWLVFDEAIESYDSYGNLLAILPLSTPIDGKVSLEKGQVLITQREADTLVKLQSLNVETGDIATYDAFLYDFFERSDQRIVTKEVVTESGADYSLTTQDGMVSTYLKDGLFYMLENHMNELDIYVYDNQTLIYQGMIRPMNELLSETFEFDEMKLR